MRNHDKDNYYWEEINGMKIPTGDVFDFFSKIVNSATSDNGNVVDAVSARVVDTEVPEKALSTGGKKKRGRPRKKNK